MLNDDGTPKIDPVTGKPLETYTNEDIESFARAWTGFQRVGVRGNYEEDSRSSSGNRLDPMFIEADRRDPFPKSNLNQGFIGDHYLLCSDLPAQPFLKAGARYRLLGGQKSPELMSDPSFFLDTSYDILRLELTQGPLYGRLFNGGNYEVSVELESDLICIQGPECGIDTLRLVKVGSVYYEYVERPCVQFAFYDNGKQISTRNSYVTAGDGMGQICGNPDLPHAREACCRGYRRDEVNSAEMESNVTYKFEGERMKWATAQERCVDYGKDLCFHENVNIVNNDNYYKRKGYHWTDRDCAIHVKVNS